MKKEQETSEEKNEEIADKTVNRRRDSEITENEKSETSAKSEKTEGQRTEAARTESEETATEKTAPSTAFPDLTEKHPCPHRYCALLEELKTTPDLYDLLHSYCTFPESLDNLYGTPLAHLRCDCCLYAHALIRLRQRPASRWKRIKKYLASLLPAFLKKKKKA